jgi:hypothetical protein
MHTLMKLLMARMLGVTAIGSGTNTADVSARFSPSGTSLRL